MDALFERREPSSVVEVNCFADTVCIHQAQIFDSLGGMTLMDMPEGEIAFSFAEEHICLEQQGMQVLGIFRGQLGVKAFDPSVYTRQLLNVKNSSHEKMTLGPAKADEILLKLKLRTKKWG